MKKVSRFTVVFISCLFLSIIFCTTNVFAYTLRNRTLANPQVIIPKATLIPNKQGGHNYYLDGSLVGRTMVNSSGSYDVYIKGRLKYKGATFSNTGNTQFREVNKSSLDNKTPARTSVGSSKRTSREHITQNRYSGSATQIRGQQLREQNKAWSQGRQEAHKGRLNWWDY